MLSGNPLRHAPGVALLVVLAIGGSSAWSAEPALPAIEVVKDETGSRLMVGGEDFMVFGMNWDYMPIGQNYSYDFWGKPDDFIKAALEKEMSLMKAMGINVIRHYVGMPPRWVQYVYETYGIWTVINHTVGRYGMTIDGVWIPNTDYSDPRAREILKAEVRALVEEFRGTPGLLMYMLGNENNYGLSWSSFEIEALPEGERYAAKAEFLYSLFGEVIAEIKKIDADVPVTMANGDLGYIDLIAKHCDGLDVFGTNVYRGISARDLYEEVEAKLGLPIMYTEFGCDAFNAITMKEDQINQAYYLLGQWREIYEQSAGKGKVGNAIGGMIFQWSDGWWKFRQEERLDIHDTNASWPNGGYPFDYREGENNMNEEWWGICAKGFNDSRGLYEVYPRAAYYALRDAFRLDPYAPDTDLDAIIEHFGRISPMGAVTAARGDKAALVGDKLSKVRVSNLRMEFETFSTGGENTAIPEDITDPVQYPAFRGFDQQQSFYMDVEAQPNSNVVGRLSLNVLGQVAKNPIDEIFYENRGRSRTVADVDGDEFDLNDLNRVQIYQASINWDDRWFMLDAFYRTGHLHWQYEGDFFGLYRDAFYGENLDIYNGEAPLGVEISGKRMFSGLKLAFGPQLWWGANPAFFVKYQRNFAGFGWTTIFQEDFAQQTETTSSIAIPVPKTRKWALSATKSYGGFDFEGGVLWAGQPRKGDVFQLVDEEIVASGEIAPGDVKQDRIKAEDAFGFKGKLIWQKGAWRWYGQGAYMGLVADGGPSNIHTFTGWQLKDSGSGNQTNALTGFTYNKGDWQFGPNFLWQKPLVGPMPHSEDLIGTAGRPRNWQSDPFAVIWNRETTAAEILITYDPQPATWFYAWDNDRRESADLAFSLGLVLRKHHTTADAGLFVADTGVIYPHPGGTPARDWGDLWHVHARIVNRLPLFGEAKQVSMLMLGTAEPRGDDERLDTMFGLGTRLMWPRVSASGTFSVNSFGPYDYHREFNMTYPLQVMWELSYHLGNPQWFYGENETRIGVRATYRTLDRYSPRYAPEGEPVPEIQGELYPEGLPDGKEWEIRTFLHLSI
ncbi:MAG: glycosidase [Candidatus Krumholzibacteriia bacterium]